MSCPVLQYLRFCSVLYFLCFIIFNFVLISSCVYLVVCLISCFTSHPLSLSPVHRFYLLATDSLFIYYHRCYRFGQQKCVYVYRLLADRTLEERIYRKQVLKMQLAARVVDAKMPVSTSLITYTLTTYSSPTHDPLEIRCRI